MKRLFLLLCVLSCQMCALYAADRPTAHGVLYGGCSMRCERELFAGNKYINYLGGWCSIGIEGKNKYVISSVQYRYCGGSSWHEIGIMESINLVPAWCYSPINLHALIGCGGDVVLCNVWRPYASIGGELSFGQLHYCVQFFCRYEYTHVFNSFECGFAGIGKHYASIGLKFMLGSEI